MTSDVWNAFKVDEKDYHFAICAECNQRVQRVWGESKSSTTSMINHFEKCHKEWNLKTYKKQTEKVPKVFASKQIVDAVEQTRRNVMNSLTKSLIARSKEIHNLTLKDEEIAEIALQIELEMYKRYENTGPEYKVMHQNLLFNIEDPRNLTFFNKILGKTLTPEAIVKLKFEEMASQQDGPAIENVSANETNTSVQNIELTLSEDNTRKSREIGRKDSGRGRKRDRSVEDRESYKRRKKSCDGMPRTKEGGNNKDRDYHDKNKDSSKNDKEFGISVEVADKLIEEQMLIEETSSLRSTSDGNEEFSSVKSIKTPEIEASNNEEQAMNVEQQVIWKTTVKSEVTAEFSMIAREINGKSCDLMSKLPSLVNMVGRISLEQAWKYFEEIKKQNAEDLIVLKLEPADDEDKIPFASLYSYLVDRSRLGVINDLSKSVKRLYLMPFSGQVPLVLQSLVSGAFDETWSKLLLGIIVRNKDPETIAIEKQGGILIDSSCAGSFNDR